MSSYKIDRSRLEAESTEEILRILKEERDDYTADAIQIFEDVLEARGIKRGEKILRAPSRTSGVNVTRASHDSEELLVRNPEDAVHMLNHLLKGVLDGTLDPQVGEIASHMVMGILRAMEQEFMTDSQEET